MITRKNCNNGLPGLYQVHSLNCLYAMMGFTYDKPSGTYKNLK